MPILYNDTVCKLCFSIWAFLYSKDSPVLSPRQFLHLLCRKIKFCLFPNPFTSSHLCLYLTVAAVPSAPRSVISSVNETSLVLEWSEPRDLGGREDILYNVICKKCLPERGMCSRCDDNVDIAPRHLGLTLRRVMVRNLQAHTQYSFEIQAVNGVSSKSPYAPQLSAVNITTNQAGRYNCLSEINIELVGHFNFFHSVKEDTKNARQNTLGLRSTDQFLASM